MDRSRKTIDTTETTHLYDTLAPIYDAWQASNEMRPFALVASAKLLPVLDREAHEGPFAFLDMGCGTGTLLCDLRVHHPGWELAGVDGSRGMLAVARAKPQAGSIAWSRARLGDGLPFGPVFDAAGTFYDTLNHLPDDAAISRALAAASAVVRPGGLVVFDVTNRLGFESWWLGTTRFRAAAWRLSIDARFDRSSQVGVAEVTIERGGRPRRFTLVERLVDDGRIRGMLAGAGLVVERAEPWSPFELDMPGKTWWVARKPLAALSGAKST